MKYLQILNYVALALATTLALVLGVVCVLYAFNLDAAPRLRDDLRDVFVLAMIFLGIAALSALAVAGVRGRRRWWPAAELLLIAGTGMAAQGVWAVIN